MKLIEKLESKYLFAPKLVYLLVNLQFYGFHQLRFAFAKEKFGISEEVYGKFTGYTQFFTFFTNIMIGNISDRTKKHKKMLLCLTILSTLVFLHFYIAPVMGLHPMMFWVFIMLYLMVNNPKQPLLDKIIIEYLECFTAAGSKIYGKQRLWGTISLSLATFLCEWCITAEDGSFDFNYLIHYNLIATVLAVSSVFFLVKTKSDNVYSRSSQSGSLEKLEKDAKANQAETVENNHNETSQNRDIEDQSINNEMNTVKEVNLNKLSYSQNAEQSRSVAFIELFKNKEFMFFILVIFSNAVTRSALTIYLSLFHKEILKIKPYQLPEEWPVGLKSFIGIFNNKPISTLTTFGIVFEMGIMFIADKILDRLGYFWPLILAQLIAVVRFLAYYLLSSSNKHVYGLSCAFELLRGIYFGMIHISSVHIAPKLAPPSFKATSQMMYQGTFAAVGSLVSGYVFGDMFKHKITKLSTVAEKEIIYKQIFLINTVIALVTTVVCFVKYGIIDKVLFSREAENRKLNSYEIEQES
ncbi:hypothetical protein GINT2_000877 [Glugoides intestinalis]